MSAPMRFLARSCALIVRFASKRTFRQCRTEVPAACVFILMNIVILDAVIVTIIVAIVVIVVIVVIVIYIRVDAAVVIAATKLLK